MIPRRLTARRQSTRLETRLISSQDASLSQTWRHLSGQAKVTEMKSRPPGAPDSKAFSPTLPLVRPSNRARKEVLSTRAITRYTPVSRPSTHHWLRRLWRSRRVRPSSRSHTRAPTTSTSPRATSHQTRPLPKLCHGKVPHWQDLAWVASAATTR